LARRITGAPVASVSLYDAAHYGLHVVICYFFTPGSEPAGAWVD